jgi:hypothetical protein
MVDQTLNQVLNSLHIARDCDIACRRPKWSFVVNPKISHERIDTLMIKSWMHEEFTITFVCLVLLWGVRVTHGFSSKRNISYKHMWEWRVVEMVIKGWEMQAQDKNLKDIIYPKCDLPFGDNLHAKMCLSEGIPHQNMWSKPRIFTKWSWTKWSVPTWGRHEHHHQWWIQGEQGPAPRPSATPSNYGRD